MNRATLRRLPTVGALFDGVHSDMSLYKFLRAYDRTTIDEAIAKQPMSANIIVWVNDLWGTHRSPDAAHRIQNLGGLLSLKRANVFDLKPRQRVSFMRALNGETALSIDGIYKHKKRNKFAIVVHQPNDYSMHALFGVAGAAAGAGVVAGSTALTKLVDRKLGDDELRKQNLAALDYPVANILKFDEGKLKSLEGEWNNFKQFMQNVNQSSQVEGKNYYSYINSYKNRYGPQIAYIIASNANLLYLNEIWV